LLTITASSITIRLPAEKRKALNELADKEGLPASGIIRNMIYKRLEQEEEKSA
jgi:predicted DNA-binding protein